MTPVKRIESSRVQNTVTPIRHQITTPVRIEAQHTLTPNIYTSSRKIIHQTPGSVLIEHSDIPIPQDITVPITYSPTPVKLQKTTFAQTSFHPAVQQQIIQTSKVVRSKVTNPPAPVLPQQQRSSALIATETFNSLTSSKLQSDNNRYKKLWIKKIEEIANLKKEITQLCDSITEKDVEINRFKSMYEETHAELKTFQIEKMKKSKLLIENKMNGDKYKQLYEDSKDQNKLL
jgi:hypothetical protein